MWKYAPWAMAAFFAYKWQEATDVASRTQQNFSKFVTMKKEEEAKRERGNGSPPPALPSVATAVRLAKP